MSLNNKILCLITILSFLFANQAFAQKKYTIASLSYMGLSNANYTDPNISSNPSYLALNISLPIVLNDKTAIVTGIRGNNWTLSYKPEQIWPTSYYSLGLNLGINHKFSDNKTLLFVVLPKLNSDFKEINAESLQVGFLTTYAVRKNEHFLWKVGMYYNNEFFGSLIVPIYGLDWNLNEKLNISGDLPIYGKLNYKIKENFSAGLGYIALVSSYRLTENFDNDYTSRFAIEPYLYGEAKLLKNIYLNAKAGYTFGRNYAVYDKDDKVDWQLSFVKFGDDRMQQNPIIENGLFFEFGLAYKIDIE